DAAVQEILAHQLGIALTRVTIAAPAAGLGDETLAGLELELLHLAHELAFGPGGAIDGDLGRRTILAAEEAPLRRLGAIEMQGHRGVGQKLIFLDHVHAATELARAAAVNAQFDPVDADGRAAFQGLDRHVAEVARRRMDDGADAVALGAGTPAAIQRLAAHEGTAGARVLADDEDVP